MNENYQGNNYPPQPDNVFTPGPSGKSRGVAALLAILLGGLGVQYFYLGKTTGGIIAIILSLVTCGVFEIIWLIQGILMFTLTQPEFENKYVYTTRNFPIF